MVTRLPNASQQAAADAVVDLVDGGAGAGTLRIYTGAQPADADDAAAGTLLVTVTLPDPAFGAANTSGVASLTGAAGPFAAVATGTAGWFRVEDSDGNTVFDGECRATGDADNGEELVLDNTSIASGQDVTINTMTYTHPASE